MKNDSVHLSVTGVRDPDAWERAVAAANPPLLLLFVERRLGVALRGKTTPDDILQDAMVEAWRSRDSFMGDANDFRNWLLRIIEHRITGAADHFAALKRGGAGIASRSDDTDTPSRSIPAPHARSATGAVRAGLSEEVNNHPSSTTPSRTAWYREQAEAVRAAMATLPADLQEIVRQRLIDRTTIECIASSMGLTIPMVRSRFRRGSEMLRSQLVCALGTRSVRQTETPPNEHAPL